MYLRAKMCRSANSGQKILKLKLCFSRYGSFAKAQKVTS